MGDGSAALVQAGITALTAMPEIRVLHQAEQRAAARKNEIEEWRKKEKPSQVATKEGSTSVILVGLS